MNNQITFGYWGIRGKAEPIRYLIEYLGLHYNDQRYGSLQEWGADKESFKNPLANIPYLKDGSELIFESSAVCVYLIYKANRLELLGDNPRDQVLVSQAKGVFDELSSLVYKPILGPPEQFDSWKIIESIMGQLKKLEFLYGGRKFLTGDQPKLIDFYIYELLDLVKVIDDWTLSSYKTLYKTHAAFREIPQIKAYILSGRMPQAYFPSQPWEKKPQLTLAYWGLRGRAQPLRFLLEYCELEYKDKKYTSKEQWSTKKKEMLKKNPLANIPYISCNKTHIFESASLPFFIISKAQKRELLPKTLEENVKCAQVKGIIGDIQQSFGEFFQKQPFNLQEAVEKFKPFVLKLEFLLNGNLFVSGDHPKLVDFELFELIEQLLALDSESFSAYPNINKMHEAFKAIPQIKSYMQSDRFQAKPFFPPNISPI